jgi:hypothetical protein
MKLSIKQQLQLHDRITAYFTAWFQTGSVDFWSETNAPDNLSEIAVRTVTDFLKDLPKEKNE